MPDAFKSLQAVFKKSRHLKALAHVTFTLRMRDETAVSELGHLFSEGIT